MIKNEIHQLPGSDLQHAVKLIQTGACFRAVINPTAAVCTEKQ